MGANRYASSGGIYNPAPLPVFVFAAKKILSILEERQDFFITTLQFFYPLKFSLDAKQIF
jgi:hypothetical protein